MFSPEYTPSFIDYIRSSILLQSISSSLNQPYPNMDTLTLFIISGVISLWIVWQMTQINRQADDSRLSVLQFASNTIAGILFMVLLYTDIDLLLLTLLLIICLPFTLYSYYYIYTTDKRMFISTTAVLAGLIIIIWVAAYF